MHRKAPAAALIAVVLVVASCDAGPAEEASGEVVLYTSMPSSVVDRLEGVVEQEFPDLDGMYWVSALGEGITLRVVRGRTADIEQRIAQEIDEGGILADVIWLAEPSPYERYKDLGLLAPYSPPPDAPIRAGYIDSDGYFVAGRVISMVVAWNTALWPRGLNDWSDLWRMERSAFPAPESGAARTTIKALLDRYGTDFFTELVRSGGVSVPSNGDARDGLADGPYEAAAVLDYMARQAKASGLPVDYAYPSSGTVIIPSPIAITSEASNPEAARLLVDFILSQAGQEIVVQIGSFYPVRSDVGPPPGAPPLNTISVLEFDWESLATEVAAISDLWTDLYGNRDRPTDDTP